MRHRGNMCHRTVMAFYVEEKGNALVGTNRQRHLGGKGVTSLGTGDGVRGKRPATAYLEAV